MTAIPNSPDYSEHDLLKEDCMSLSKAARRLPHVRGSKPPHPSTLFRWAEGGRRSKMGVLVRLEIVRVGGTNCTSMEALSRFFDRLYDVEKESQPVTAKQKDAETQTRTDQAMRTLRQRGLAK